MKLLRRAALWASILSLTALTACDRPEVVFRTPALNAHDRAHLTCQSFPEIRDTLRALPPHIFLSGSNGQPVITPGGHKWVRWDIVNSREAILIQFGDIDARIPHFECKDDLQWLAKVWTALEHEP